MRRPGDGDTDPALGEDLVVEIDFRSVLPRRAGCEATQNGGIGVGPIPLG